MVDISKTPPIAVVKTKQARKGWSAKSLARNLSIFVKDKGIGKDATVHDLFEALKKSIVEQEVGGSLDF